MWKFILLSTICWKRLSFFYYMFLYLSDIRWLQLPGFVLSPLFYLLLYVCFHASAYCFVTVALQNHLRLGIVIYSFKIVLFASAIQSLFCDSILRLELIFFLQFCKECHQNFEGPALTLQVVFGSTAIFTILVMLIHAHEWTIFYFLQFLS